MVQGKAAAVGGELAESSRRQNFRPARKVAALKGRKKVAAKKGRKKVAAKKGRKKVVPELPKGKKILTEAGVANILRRMHKDGDPILFSPTIHEADVYSKPPKDLVEEFGERTVWMNGLGIMDNISLFRDSGASARKTRRCRRVGGSGLEENGKWHGEGRAKPIQKVLWASRKQYSYTINGNSSTNPTGERTGWCMAEFSLTDQKQGTGLICVVYQSNRSYAETPTADTGSTGAETPWIENGHNEAEEEDDQEEEEEEEEDEEEEEEQEEEDRASVVASIGPPGAGTDMRPPSIGCCESLIVSMRSLFCFVLFLAVCILSV
jgi:hypothetical protein